jgi:hypothetical protein
VVRTKDHQGKEGVGGVLCRLTTTQKVVEWAMNKPLTISLPNCYWDVLYSMAHLQGKETHQEIEEYATERLKQIIIEDVIHSWCDEGFFGKLLCKGWEETLKDDPYYKAVC